MALILIFLILSQYTLTNFFNCLLPEISDAFRYEDTVDTQCPKLKLSNRMGKKADLNYFERGIV